MNHDCCLQSSVWRQVLLFNINQSLLGWGRWCEYKCVVMIPDNEMILAAARLKQRREIEIINMNEPYLCLMHAREILLLIVLTIHNELTYLLLQSWYSNCPLLLESMWQGSRITLFTHQSSLDWWRGMLLLLAQHSLNTEYVQQWQHIIDMFETLCAIQLIILHWCLPDHCS